MTIERKKARSSCLDNACSPHSGPSTSLLAIPLLACFQSLSTSHWHICNIFQKKVKYQIIRVCMMSPYQSSRLYLQQFINWLTCHKNIILTKTINLSTRIFQVLVSASTLEVRKPATLAFLWQDIKTQVAPNYMMSVQCFKNASIASKVRGDRHTDVIP